MPATELFPSPFASAHPAPTANFFARSSASRPWWRDTVVYQIYPRSFQDSNGDGIGDLPGIISRLDYLKALGVGTLWLSPIYASPNDDNGYDISDYDAIHPEFGTMADFDRLLAEAHARSLRVILDLVVNHTSDEHPWFVESRSSRDNPKRDFYHWHPGRPDGSAPNNWESFFKGPAWDRDPATGEYYLHLFSRKQPDLNWTHPEVRHAIYQMMHRWLRKGVDGFRMDVVNFLAKAPGFPDAPAPDGAALAFGGHLYANQPGIHEHLQEMHAQVLRHYDVVSIGECHFIDHRIALDYTDPRRRELNLLFPFDLVYESDLHALLDHVDRWHQAYVGRGTPTITLNNHDTPRLVSKFGDPARHRAASAKLYATLLLTAPGVPFLYQGEELGMTNVRFDSIADYRDIEMLNRHRTLLAEGLTETEALDRLRPACRDNARTPVQWDASPGAGFTTGTPWIGLNPNHTEINAAAQEHDPASVLAHYRRLLAFRRNSSALLEGDYVRLSTPVRSLFVFERRAPGEHLRILLNLADTELMLAPDALPPPPAELELVLGNLTTTVLDASRPPLRLAPWEARVYRVLPA